MRTETILLKCDRPLTKEEVDSIIENNEYFKVEMWWSAKLPCGLYSFAWTDYWDKYEPEKVEAMEVYIRSAVKKLLA